MHRTCQQPDGLLRIGARLGAGRMQQSMRCKVQGSPDSPTDAAACNRWYSAGVQQLELIDKMPCTVFA